MAVTLDGEGIVDGCMVAFLYRKTFLLPCESKVFTKNTTPEHK